MVTRRPPSPITLPTGIGAAVAGTQTVFGNVPVGATASFVKNGTSVGAATVSALGVASYGPVTLVAADSVSFAWVLTGTTPAAKVPGTAPAPSSGTSPAVVFPASSFSYVTDESGNRMTDESGNYMVADDAFVQLVTPYSASINRVQFSTGINRSQLGTDTANTDPFEFAVADTDMLVQAGATTPFKAKALGFDKVEVWHSFAKKLDLVPAADGTVQGDLPISGIKNGPLYVEMRAIRNGGSYECDASFWLFITGGQDYSLAAPAAAAGMTLKWSDQFDTKKIAAGSTRPTGANWFCHMPSPSQDYGGAKFGEPGNSQYDPFTIIKNGSDHGWLRIRAKYDPAFVMNDTYSRPWIAGTITSCWPDGTSPYEFANGVYRTKMLMPMGKGAWPAYWFLDLSHQRGVTTTSQSREVDIQEGYGYFAGGIYSQHRYGSGQADTTQGYTFGSGNTEQMGWAVRDISVLMTDTQIKVYIDDVLVVTDTKFNPSGAPNPALNIILHTLAKSTPQSSGWPTGNPPPGKYQDMYIMCSEYWA